MNLCEGPEEGIWHTVDHYWSSSLEDQLGFQLFGVEGVGVWISLVSSVLCGGRVPAGGAVGGIYDRRWHGQNLICSDKGVGGGRLGGRHFLAGCLLRSKAAVAGAVSAVLVN